MKNDLYKAYAEVDEILPFMEDVYIDKIPKKLRELFKNERLEDYKPNIDPKIPLDEQKLQKKTFSILAMLNLNYWCEDEKEKQDSIGDIRKADCADDSVHDWSCRNDAGATAGKGRGEKSYAMGRKSCPEHRFARFRCLQR